LGQPAHLKDSSVEGKQPLPEDREQRT